MFIKKTAAVVATGALALVASVTAHAEQDQSALLDLLVKKKVISTAEADQVSAELDKQSAQSSADKIKLSSSVTELKLGGDLRLRYQHDNRDLQVDPPTAGTDEDRSPSGSQRSLWRFRLRLNADFKLGPDIFGGVQLVTGQPSDSDMQTIENGFSDYNIFISRAFVGWNAADWLTIVGGKHPNPLYTTELVWDSDINPTGASATFKAHELFGGAPETAGFSKDGKALTASTATSPWELSLVLGGYIYDDNDDSAFDNDASDDAYIGAAQIVGSYQFSKNLKATFAPGILLFNAADLSGFNNNNPFSDVAGISGESRKQTILTAPGDVSFKLAGVKTKFYWDFAYNTQGQERFDDIYGLVILNSPTTGFRSLHDTDDDIAWLAGVQLGELKKSGDWQFNLNWRQTGISSVDPNLNDSDFALAELNTRGLKAQLFYAFTEAVNIGASYQYAWNLKDNLIGGQATGGSAIADGNNVQVFQVDLNVKF